MSDWHPHRGLRGPHLRARACARAAASRRARGARRRGRRRAEAPPRRTPPAHPATRTCACQTRPSSGGPLDAVGEPPAGGGRCRPRARRAPGQRPPARPAGRRTSPTARAGLALPTRSASTRRSEPPCAAQKSDRPLATRRRVVPHRRFILNERSGRRRAPRPIVRARSDLDLRAGRLGACRIQEDATRAQVLRRAIIGGGAIVGAAPPRGELPQLTAAASKEQDARVLNLVLAVEYTEAAFYREALERGGLEGDAQGLRPDRRSSTRRTTSRSSSRRSAPRPSRRRATTSATGRRTPRPSPPRR